MKEILKSILKAGLSFGLLIPTGWVIINLTHGFVGFIDAILFSIISAIVVSSIFDFVEKYLP